MSENITDFLIHCTTIATGETDYQKKRIPTAKVLSEYGYTIQKHLKEQGFSGIRRLSKGKGFVRSLFSRASDDDIQSTILQTEYKGKRVYIVFPETVTCVLDLQGFSERQVKFCKKELRGATICHAQLAHQLSDAHTLLLTECNLVAEDGVWPEDDDNGRAQFLPFSMRGQLSAADAFFGPVAASKYAFMLVSTVRSGKEADLQVKGLFDAEASAQSPSLILMHPAASSFLAQVKAKDGQVSELENTWFNLEKAELSEVEVFNPPAPQATDGCMQLMDETGTVFTAQCIEAAVLPRSFSMGTRLRGNLHMVASRITDTGKDFAITSGPLFEIAKDDYRRDHGCEPPADFAVNCTTKEMRIFRGDDETPFATATGVVQSVEDMDLVYTKLLHLTIHCIPDNDHVVLHVYMHKDVPGNYRPAVGDNVTCSGMLTFICAQAVPTEKAWVDSDKPAQLEMKGEVSAQALHAYSDISPHSLALATVAANIVEWGWAIEESPCIEHTRQKGSFLAVKGDGRRVVVTVDIAVNGHEPQLTYGPELRQHLRKMYSDYYGCEVDELYCRMGLNFDESMQGYRFEGSLSPESDKGLNLPLFCKGHYPASTLSLRNGKAERVRHYPEVLDEAEASRNFNDAFIKGDIGAFALWLRDDLHYTSATANVEYFSKEDFLRHMAERIAFWKGNGTWEMFRCKSGTVEYNGKRRPCSAIYLSDMEMAVGCTVFDDKEGLIGGMSVLPKSVYHSFIPSPQES